MRIAGADSARGLTVGLEAGVTRLMGIVNVTPDSFSDGGRHADCDSAVAHGLRLLAEGADVLDIGGESTRPGHEVVSDAEQIRRVVPVLTALRDQAPTAILSVDTTRAPVARAALDAGADWVNDTLAFQADPDLAPLVAERGCPVVLMHRFDPPRTSLPVEDTPPSNAVAGLITGLRAATARAEAAGISRDRIILDPGIGFGTRHADNVAIHAGLEAIRAACPLPLLVGSSRKSFLGWLTDREDPADRLCATAASVATLALGGVEILRVHDVAAMRDVVRVVDAIRAAGATLSATTAETAGSTFQGDRR